MEFLDKRKTPVPKEKKFVLSAVELRMFLSMYEKSEDDYVTLHRKKYGEKTKLKFQTMLDEVSTKINSCVNVYVRPDHD